MSLNKLHHHHAGRRAHPSTGRGDSDTQPFRDRHLRHGCVLQPVEMRHLQLGIGQRDGLLEELDGLGHVV